MLRYVMISKTNCVTKITKVAFLLTSAVSVATCGYLQTPLVDPFRIKVTAKWHHWHHPIAHFAYKRW